jgi:hypothetical protein
MTADDTSTEAARRRPYAEGSVWSVQFMRTQPGTSKEYLRTLGGNWKPLMEEAKRREIIRDYRVLISPQGHREDWDVMLVVEVADMSVLDGYNDRMEEVLEQMSGGSAGCADLQDMHGRPPDLMGMKLVREITFE